MAGPSGLGCTGRPVGAASSSLKTSDDAMPVEPGFLTKTTRPDAPLTFYLRGPRLPPAAAAWAGEAAAYFRRRDSVKASPLR